MLTAAGLRRFFYAAHTAKENHEQIAAVKPTMGRLIPTVHRYVTLRGDFNWLLTWGLYSVCKCTEYSERFSQYKIDSVTAY
jgi:hypothetical protein